MYSCGERTGFLDPILLAQLPVLVNGGNYPALACVVWKLRGMGRVLSPLRHLVLSLPKLVGPRHTFLIT
jgi:hypothetical protein